MGCGCTYIPKTKTLTKNTREMDQPIINKFASPDFAIKFAVDNNPAAIYTKLAAWGINVNTPEQAIAAIKKLAANGNRLAITDVFSVPYINSATNGTGGLREFFVKNSPAPQGTNTARTFWDGVLSFLGGGLSSLAQMQQSPGVGLTPEQIAAIEAERKKKEEEEAAKRKTMYWVIGIIVFIIILVIVLAIFAGKKEEKK